MVKKHHSTNYIDHIEANEKSFRIKQYLDHLDQVSYNHEAKWGIGVLEGYADPDLLAKWNNQWEVLNNAVEQNWLDGVASYSAGCIRAWAALEEAALAKGHQPTDAEYWECQHPETGTIYRFTKNQIQAQATHGQTTGARIYSLLEVVRILESSQIIGDIKDAFPGSEVKTVEQFDFDNGDEIPL